MLALVGEQEVGTLREAVLVGRENFGGDDGDNVSRCDRIRRVLAAAAAPA